MTDQLEFDLRAAFRDRAAEVPATSIARISHLDYRPRTRGLRPPVAIGAAVGTAGTAGAVAAVISLGAGASNAFAGWTPQPTPSSPAQVAAADVNCKARSPIAGLPLKLTDTRGPFTFSVYADSNSSATCIAGPSFTAVSASVSSAAASVSAGRVQLQTSHTRGGAGNAYSFADGHTGAGVQGVTLVLDDGAKVQATVANDWFVAWWPGAHGVKSAVITTPAGVKTQVFNLSRQSPCGANACPGDGVGSRSSGPLGPPASASGGGSMGFSSGSFSGRAKAAGRGAPVESFGVTRSRALR